MSSDPLLEAFLEFLADQMQANPHLIKPLTGLERAEELVRGIDVDLDEDLGEELSLD